LGHNVTFSVTITNQLTQIYGTSLINLAQKERLLLSSNQFSSLFRLRRIVSWAAPNGGEGGIRTPGTLSGTTDFESVTFGHSATSPNSLELIGDLHLLKLVTSAMARSPSGKAEDCKSSIVGSIPTRASTFIKALIRDE
jgi:hypothetical protein